MILSDIDIKKHLKNGKIKITPKPDLKSQLGSCSIDLHLGDVFKVFDSGKFPFIDTRDPKIIGNITKEIKIKKGESFILQPGDFVLAATKENIILPDNLLARLEGRSSLGRLGIVVHSTASVIDPGFRGVIVMELGNLGKMPIALYPGIRICALTFEQISSRVETPYYKKKNAKYINQLKP